MYDLPDEVRVEAEGPVRTIVLNRPDDLNAANAGLHAGVAAVWRQVAADPGARVAILTGAGRAFSAGGDFGMMVRFQQDLAFRETVIREGRQILTDMIAFPLPLVAAVNGPAVGLGTSLAVACDIVLISDRAFLADPHVGVGLVCGDGGAAIWPALTSLLRAKEFLFTGDRIPAETAVQLGLANRVVPAGDLMAEANALAHRLAAQPQQALRDTKRALQMHLERAVNGPLDFAIAAEAVSMGSPEHAERVAALRRDVS